MPQMAPISWLILFLIFSLTFIIFNILNYYCFYKKNQMELMKTNTKQKNLFLNWKW